MGYACTWTSVWWGFMKVIMFILASFLFSFIFWATKKWMDLCPYNGKKKKKR